MANHCGSCAERGKAIARGASAVVRGDLRTAAAAASFVGRTLAQDARSGALRNAAAAQLANMRASISPRRR